MKKIIRIKSKFLSLVMEMLLINLIKVRRLVPGIIRFVGVYFSLLLREIEKVVRCRVLREFNRKIWNLSLLLLMIYRKMLLSISFLSLVDSFLAVCRVLSRKIRCFLISKISLLLSYTVILRRRKRILNLNNRR